VARPYVLVSAAVSLDGYLDDASPRRLLLSNEADFDRVDEVRAGCDAILVGAETVRRDNPRLLVRSAARRAVREARGEASTPLRAVLSTAGRLDPGASVFTAFTAPEAASETLLYVTEAGFAAAKARLGGVAVVTVAEGVSAVLADLARRGVRRLMVEGGSSVQTEFLHAGLVDELHLAVAPFFVGDPAAPRFAGPGSYPHGPDKRMRLVESRPIGDVVLLRYLLGGVDE
jgi:5-amino-6-(5-phosphoribosylamino)uracil reductase